MQLVITYIMSTISKYATRTCNKCGVKKSSNKIYQKTVERSYSGKSRRSINIFTWVGIFLGDKGSARAIKQYLFQSSNRKYGASSTKQINLCVKCFHGVSSHNRPGVLKALLLFPYYFLKFFLTSPLIKELVIYIFGIVVWLIIKLLKILRFFGIKILDQDGDGDLDKKDLEVAYQKVSVFFSKFKNSKNKTERENLKGDS